MQQWTDPTKLKILIFLVLLVRESVVSHLMPWNGATWNQTACNGISVLFVTDAYSLDLSYFADRHFTTYYKYGHWQLYLHQNLKKSKKWTNTITYMHQSWLHNNWNNLGQYIFSALMTQIKDIQIILFELP